MHSLTLNTIRACVIRSIFYEHFYCTLCLGAYTLDFQRMQRCETNENADLLIKIEIGSTFSSSISIAFFRTFHNHAIKLSIAILHLQILTFLLKFFYLIICIISTIFYLTKSGTTLRTFRQHLPLSSVSLTNFSYIYRE